MKFVHESCQYFHFEQAEKDGERSLFQPHFELIEEAVGSKRVTVYTSDLWT
jgi:hypothetical protein